MILFTAAFIVCALSSMALTAQAGAVPRAGQKAETPASRVDAIVEETVTRLVKQTDKHWHQGEYRHVINISKVVVTAWPDHMEGYQNAGWLLWSLDADDEAVALYEQGLKANPGTSTMYDELGFYYLHRKKDYARAIPYLEKSVTFKDSQTYTLHMLAHAYERTNQMNKALKTWERAAAVPNNAAGKVNLERVRRKMKQS